MITQLKDGQKALEAYSTTEVFIPISGWIDSIKALTKLVGYFTLNTKTGNFQYRLGIQTTNDKLTLNTPASITSDSGQQSTVGPASAKRYAFDPTGATDGNVGTAMYFRIGLLCSISSGTVGTGVVSWQGVAVKA